MYVSEKNYGIEKSKRRDREGVVQAWDKMDGMGWDADVRYPVTHCMLPCTLNKRTTCEPGCDKERLFLVVVKCSMGLRKLFLGSNYVSRTCRCAIAT